VRHRPIEHEPDNGEIADALVSIPYQALFEEPTHGGRQLAGKRRPIRIAHEHCGERVRDVLTIERPFAGQHLEHDAAEGPHVAALVGGTPLGLLGTHISRGAENDAGLRHRRTRNGR